MDDLALLRLMHLADSALPIGSTAHSFGLETLVVEGVLSVERLEAFLRDYFQENGALECLFCRSGYRLTAEPDTCVARCLALNARLSALKTARESRVASTTLGRRFLQLVQTLEERPVLQRILQEAKVAGGETHYCVAFGLVGGILVVDEMATLLAYLQQSLLGLISACQRLMPLGQSQASGIAWRLKPLLIAIAQRVHTIPGDDEALLNYDAVFTPLLDLGSMCHPTLKTRLFIS